MVFNHGIGWTAGGRESSTNTHPVARHSCGKFSFWRRRGILLLRWATTRAQLGLPVFKSPKSAQETEIGELTVHK